MKLHLITKITIVLFLVCIALGQCSKAAEKYPEYKPVNVVMNGIKVELTYIEDEDGKFIKVCTDEKCMAYELEIDD